GDYVGEMTDANGCTASIPITITEPTALTAVITSTTDVTCFGDCDGDATVLAGGGTSGYTYLWNDLANQTTATASALCPTTYSVSVTDANGCVLMVPATIIEPLQILATATAVDAFCNTGSGSVTTTVTQGGVGVFSYLWTPSGITTNPATGLAPGIYSVDITDADGCVGTTTATVGNIPASVATGQVLNNVSCNGLCDGQATVSMGGTGTAPYTYEWYNATTGAQIGQPTQNATGLCAGDYYCIATDINTCNSISDTIVITEPTVLTVTTGTTDATCKLACTGTATATSAGGTGIIVYQWDDPLLQNTQTATGLCAGTYNVVITDANDCTATEVAIVVEPTAIVLDSTVINANCGLPDGSGCVTATGGVGGFTYSWPSGATTPCDAGLIASSYLVTVTDANTCSEQIVVTVSDLLGPSAAIIAQTEVTCFGFTDGSATVDMTGGAGTSFTALWDANAGGQTTPTASNLGAGTYTVTITDNLGCSASTSATITEPNAITTNAGFVDPLCFGYCDGALGVVVAGGTTPYDYQWLDATNTPIGANTDSLTGMCSGAYTLTITDANGCTEILSYTLTDPAQVSASSSSTNVFCNGACDGAGIAAGVIGLTSFSYQWDVAAGNQTTATATGLCPGTYNCVVSDINGCFTSVIATVTEPPVLTTSIINVGMVSCNAACDGFAEVLIAGGTSPYNINWGIAGTSQVVTNLCAGTYTVTVTDANNCSSTSTVIITEPAPLGVSSISANNSCYQACDGTGSVSVSGGTLPYTYLWDNPGFSTSPNVAGLCAGTWTCTITDANGCTVTESILISEPSLLGISVQSVVDANCGQANGSICVTSVGGVGPFTYAWNDPNATTTACLIGVASNCYQVAVLDANGCSVDSTICISNIAGPTVTLGVVTDVSCFGANDGTMDFTVSSITGGLTYEFTDAAGTVLSTTVGPYTGLSGGNYFLQVTDGVGCIAQDGGFIAEPNALNSAITSSTDATCFAACDGQALVAISGGSIPYSISWNDGQTTNLATGLCAGSYTATITDANLCTSTSTVVIAEPAVLAIADVAIPVTCNGGNDGSITLTVTGGTPAYNYLWAPAISSGSVGSSLTAGAYNIDVTDANGCLAQTVVNVTEPPALNVTSASVNSTCTLCNGSGSLTATGGTSPYTYQWLNGGSNPNAATNLSLCPGNHPVIVTDANGCVFSLTVIVNDEPSPQIDLMSYTEPSCSGGNNGTATVVASGGTGVLTFLWDAAAGAQTSDVAGGLAAGTYCVTVSDINNCVVSNCVTVTEPSQLLPIPDGTTTICYGDSTQVWGSGQGGTPGYTINWTPAGFSGTGPMLVNPLTSTDYCFTVTDANGCLSPSACVSITVTPPINIDMMPSTAICDGDSITVISSASGGNAGPYTFTWTDDLGNTHVPLSAGSPSSIVDYPLVDTWYYVTVSDGCSLNEVDSVQVTINSLPTAFLNVIDSSGCAEFTADFILNSDIGVNFDYDFECDGIIDYSGTNPNPSNTYPNAGLYDVCVTVTSADGCQTLVNTIGMVEVYPVPTAGFSSIPEETSEINPIIDFVDGSAGALFYDWSFGDGDSISGADSTTIGAVNTSGTVGNPTHFYDAVGTYTVTQLVTNEYGCTDQVSHVVTIIPEQTLFIPNSFTPNGDGKNDFFIPQGLSIDAEHFSMYVFNRWGELIFETHSLNQPWDGSVKGRSGRGAQTDVYVWLVKTRLLNGTDKEYKGHVTLLK
ncbi:MAG: gliding motility-associated C-terminal domain-containing protein, partial [Flavobacteriales bacterium]|nr:gliding motility-associated C-terminal domain-containing protein [Flavobacteriales bacterium]